MNVPNHSQVSTPVHANNEDDAGGVDKRQRRLDIIQNALQQLGSVSVDDLSVKLGVSIVPFAAISILLKNGACCAVHMGEPFPLSLCSTNPLSATAYFWRRWRRWLTRNVASDALPQP